MFERVVRARSRLKHKLLAHARLVQNSCQGWRLGQDSCQGLCLELGDLRLAYAKYMTARATSDGQDLGLRLKEF